MLQIWVLEPYNSGSRCTIHWVLREPNVWHSQSHIVWEHPFLGPGEGSVALYHDDRHPGSEYRQGFGTTGTYTTGTKSMYIISDLWLKIQLKYKNIHVLKWVNIYNCCGKIYIILKWLLDIQLENLCKESF